MLRSILVSLDLFVPWYAPMLHQYISEYMGALRPQLGSHGNCKVKLPKAGIMLTWVIFLGYDFQCT